MNQYLSVSLASENKLNVLILINHLMNKFQQSGKCFIGIIFCSE